jgi:hypothetical protein
MNDIGPALMEKTEEVQSRIGHMPSHIRAYIEPIRSHPFTEGTQGCNCIHGRFVPLLSLKLAHLQDQRFSAADLHAVYNMRDLHEL